jgi:hypothetical protein
MPEEPTLDPELTSFAAALAGLTPVAPAVDRDRLFFEAGRRAARPRPWGWTVAAGLCASLAFGLGVRLAAVPVAARGPQVVSGQVPAPPATAPESSAPDPTTVVAHRRPAVPPFDEMRLRELRLVWAAEAPALPVSAAFVDEPVESVLGLQRGSLNDAQLRRFKTAFSRGDI